MAPRDILAGFGWAQSIINAINGARVMVLVLSGNANGSPQIEREVERAVHKGIPVVPVRIEDVAPSATLEYFISAPHWLDAFPPPTEQHLGKLAKSVRQLLESGFARPASPGEAPQATQPAETTPFMTQAPLPPGAHFEPPPSPIPPSAVRPVGRWALPVGVLAVIALGGGALLLVGKDLSLSKPDTQTAAAAEQAEFDDAMATASTEALDRFADKHPQSPLAKTAKRESDRVAQRKADAEKREAERKAAETAKAEVERRAEEDRRAAEATKAQLAAEAARREQERKAAAKQQSDVETKAPITDCDRLAGVPMDPDKPPELSPYSFFEPAQAVAACEEALSNFPNERRFAYQYGRALEAAKRYADARKVYSIAANAGSLPAIYTLGCLLTLGRGGDKDPTEAARIFGKDTVSGHSPTINALGDLYRDAGGAAKDEAQAACLYRAAIDRGNMYAMYSLAQMYEFGEGVPKDLVQARRFYQTIVDHQAAPHQQAAEALKRLDQQGEPKELQTNFTPGVVPPLPIATGDSLEMVRTALKTTQKGQPYSNENNSPKDGWELGLPDKGLIIFFDANRKVYTIRFNAPFSGSIFGVRIGDSRASVVNRLGQPLRSWSDDTRVYYDGKVSIEYGRSNTVQTMFK
jgi:TPR repeat protein